jgi:hypothetical protein
MLEVRPPNLVDRLHDLRPKVLAAGPNLNLGKTVVEANNDMNGPVSVPVTVLAAVLGGRRVLIAEEQEHDLEDVLL